MSKKTVAIKGSGTIRGEIIQMTPLVAKEFLKTNKRNRSVVASRISRLATAMRNGEWVVAQPLMFNCDGTMIDGQHRCHAVIEANVPVPMLVIHGFDPDHTFAKIDDTATRSLSHWLSIQGEARHDILARVIRMHYMHSNGLNPFSNGGWRFVLTGPMGLKVLAETPALRKSVNECPGIINTYLPKAMCGYLHFRFLQSDKTLANRFFVDLVSGDYQGDGDPIYLLRERLKANRATKVKLRQIEIAALVIKVWNAYKADAKIKTLKWASGGEHPEAFPEIQ